jgi:hypothetical protein
MNLRRPLLPAELCDYSGKLAVLVAHRPARRRSRWRGLGVCPVRPSLTARQAAEPQADTKRNNSAEHD